jgi:hypothetical protein
MARNKARGSRIDAWLNFEVSAESLEAYRRASTLVSEVMDQAQARRLACAIEGLDPWTIPPATRAGLLCAWNAFVLQALGDAFLDADYAGNPSTIGFVPRLTHDQVMAYYAQVETWVDRANQAHANPDYRLDVPVPAELPPWREASWVAEAHPRDLHLRALLAAMRSVGEHAEAAMAILPGHPRNAMEGMQINCIRQLYERARSAAASAERLYETAPAHDGEARIQALAREAIEAYHELGQLIADPALAEGGHSPGEAAPLLPGHPDFDPLILTAPWARDWVKGRGEARVAIDRLWRLDPDPARTLALHAEIHAALERGDAAYATNPTTGWRVGPSPRCPWGPVYVARRELGLDGVLLRSSQQFVLEAGLADGFTRRVWPVAPLSPWTKV